MLARLTLQTSRMGCRRRVGVDQGQAADEVAENSGEEGAEGIAVPGAIRFRHRGRVGSGRSVGQGVNGFDDTVDFRGHCIGVRDTLCPDPFFGE